MKNRRGRNRTLGVLVGKIDTNIYICDSLDVGNVTADVATNRKREKDHPGKMTKTGCIMILRVQVNTAKKEKAE
jgi:hypothetical protein